LQRHREGKTIEEPKAPIFGAVGSDLRTSSCLEPWGSPFQLRWEWHWYSRTVFALEGDGSLLKQLGCLNTVAIRAPQNLTLVVLDKRYLPDHRFAADGNSHGSRHGRGRACMRTCG
jgi:hypothetical protein